MPRARVPLAALLVLVALAVQVTFLSRLRLPGATPDLLLLVVVSLALAYGPAFGLAVGFGAGLAADLVPPADHEVGRWALVLTLVGYLAGAARGETRRSAFVPLVVVGVAGAASVLLYAALGALMDDPNITWDAVVALLPTAVLYDVVLSAFVVPGVLAVASRVEPDPDAFAGVLR
jgi:rod shape-determining protein MreD